MRFPKSKLGKDIKVRWFIWKMIPETTSRQAETRQREMKEAMLCYRCGQLSFRPIGRQRTCLKDTHSSEEKGSTTSPAVLAAEGRVCKPRSLWAPIKWLPEVVYSSTEGTLTQRLWARKFSAINQESNKLGLITVSVNFRCRKSHTLLKTRLEFMILLPPYLY